MTQYKLQKDWTGADVAVTIVGQNISIPLHAVDNTDYQAYLKWLEEGNTPEPSDGDVVPVVAAKTTTKA